MYKPSYTWPNPAFPFREYYTGENCRIFIIENIQHNWNWLSEYKDKIRPSDIFFVYCGWYHSDYFAKEANAIFKELGLIKDNFYIMFNSSEEMANFKPYGFIGDVINHNAWLDENLVMNVLPETEKHFDAIYIARLSEFKRHYLASKVPNLALVAGINHGNPIAENLPPHVYKNQQQLTSVEVCQKINKARCGLLLSASEGACFSSSEYLLCGIPVVSTISNGGRDVWYDEYNSIVCKPHENDIRDAVHYFIENPRDPHKIRGSHIQKAQVYRNKFNEEVQRYLDFHLESINAFEHFKNAYFHKLRRSYRPDFESIFY
jgi:glycosyltransferase involved in cell wall biosynthesis